MKPQDWHIKEKPSVYLTLTITAFRSRHVRASKPVRFRHLRRGWIDCVTLSKKKGTLKSKKTNTVEC
ncbi:hypothetical protein Bca101_017184 [Brassica carinata]